MNKLGRAEYDAWAVELAMETLERESNRLLMKLLFRRKRASTTLC